MNTAAPAPIAVALVEDDDATRRRLCNAITAAPTVRLAFAAASGQALLDWFQSDPADVLLVDLGLPDIAGPELIRRCRLLQPACSIMVITLFGDEASMLGAFEAGAAGYLLKDGTESDLSRHVLDLHGGGSPMTPVIARRLLARWRAGVAPARQPAAAGLIAPDLVLSPREREVLDLVARGFLYAEIAKQLGVAVTTVQTHVRNIYGKLDVHNKTELVFEARLQGLII